jgi:predicted ATP-grasp superfamily ATP-dependent carboligase
VGAINSLSSDLRIDYILPSDGPTTEFLAAVSDQTTAKTYPVPTAGAFRILNNKATFTKLCAELGVPTPETRIYPSASDLTIAVEAGERRYPFIAKPVCMSGGLGVKKVTSKAALRGIDYNPVLAQDFVEGREICAFYSCWHGRIVTEVVYHHEDRAMVFMQNDEVHHHATRIVEHFDFHGVIGFDIIERADKSVAFLECNPRFWYNINYAMLAGLNFVEAGLFPEKARNTRVESGKRLPKLNSMASLFSSLQYGSAFWTVLKYHLADLKCGWANRQGGPLSARQVHSGQCGVRPQE